MKAYGHLSSNKSVKQVNTNCQSALFTKSYVQRWSPTYTLKVSDNSPFAGFCMDSYSSKFIGRAIMDVCRQENLDNLIFIYTEENYQVVDQVKKNMDGTEKISEWLVSNATYHNLYHELWKDLDYEIRGVILAAGLLAVDIVLEARKWNISTFDLIWVVATSGGLDTWTEAIIPGEKILLLNTIPSTLLPKSCDTTFISELFLPEYQIMLVSMATDLLEVVGYWDPISNLSVENGGLWTFDKFCGKHFTIVTRHLPIFHEKEVLKNGTVVWSGLCIEILKALADSLNFTYTLVEPADNNFGAPYPNGTWNGMVGMVYRKEADWAVAKFTVTEIRDSVVDYTSPFWYEPAVMVMKKPVENKMLVYLRPFKRDVWIALFFSVPFAGLMVAMAAYMEQQIRMPHPMDYPYVHWFWYCFDRSTWFAFGAMFQQGSVWSAHSQALRFITGMWWFFVIAVGATYTGNLIAVLAVPKTVLPVQTLNDLASQSVYSYGSMGGAALITMFNSSTSEVYQRLWNQEIQYEKNHVNSHAEGLERVKSGENYIYLGEQGGVAPVVFKDCDYALGKEEFFPSSFGFVFPENSPYIPIVNKKIITMIETGLIDSWTTEFYPRDICALMSSERMTRQASLGDVQGAFSLLLAGFLLALLCLALEFAFIWYKIRKKKESKDLKNRQTGPHSWPLFTLSFFKKKETKKPAYAISNAILPGILPTANGHSNGIVSNGIPDSNFSIPNNFLSPFEIEDMSRDQDMMPPSQTPSLNLDMIPSEHMIRAIRSRVHDRRKTIRKSIKPQSANLRNSKITQMSVRKRDSTASNNNNITTF